MIQVTSHCDEYGTTNLEGNYKDIEDVMIDIGREICGDLYAEEFKTSHKPFRSYELYEGWTKEIIADEQIICKWATVFPTNQ